MRILTVLKRYNKLFAIIAGVTIVAIYLVISLSGDYLKEVLYHVESVKQPVNNILSIEEEIIDINDDSNKKDDGFFEYIFTEDKNVGDYIYLTNLFPMSDEVGKELEGKYKVYHFTLRFSPSYAGTRYNITLEKMDGSNLRDDWVKVYLVNEGKDVSNCIRESGRIKTYNEYDLYNGKNDEVILYSGTVTAAEAKRGYKDYALRMWVSEDVTVNNEDYNEQSFIARVNVHATGNF